MVKSMKVIHIVHGKANPKEHNGISRVVYYLNKHEKTQGIDSQIWAIVDGVETHFSHQRDEHVTIECFPRVWLPIGNHEIINELINNKDNIDLVHFHLIWFYDKNIIANALKNAGIPFIVTTHGTYSKPHAYTGKRLLAKWLFEVDYLNKATEIHTITREEGTGLQKYGYKGRSFVAYNGIDIEEIPNKFNTNFFSNKKYKNKIKLVWVGVLREDKNLRSLIKAVSFLPKTLRDRFVCIIIGPDYLGNLQKYKKLSTEFECQDNFDFIGCLYGQEKYDAIASSDVNLLCSFSEVFSLAMLDSMALNKPCLVTSGCGYDYFSDENFYIRCEPYPQDIENGLKELFDKEHDWEVMGNNARKMIDNKFNWSQITKTMIENYFRIVSEQS